MSALLDSRVFRDRELDNRGEGWWRGEVGCRGRVGEAGRAHSCKSAASLPPAVVAWGPVGGAARGEGGSPDVAAVPSAAAEARGGAAVAGGVVASPDSAEIVSGKCVRAVSVDGVASPGQGAAGRGGADAVGASRGAPCCVGRSESSHGAMGSSRWSTSQSPRASISEISEPDVGSPSRRQISTSSRWEKWSQTGSCRQERVRGGMPSACRSFR